MSDLAVVVRVSVRVHIAAEPDVFGYSESAVIVRTGYSEVKLAENAVKRLRQAKASMEVRLAEKRAMEARQGRLFQESA